MARASNHSLTRGSDNAAPALASESASRGDSLEAKGYSSGFII